MSQRSLDKRSAVRGSNPSGVSRRKINDRRMAAFGLVRPALIQATLAIWAGYRPMSGLFAPNPEPGESVPGMCPSV
jgi:hypothetical protein